MKNEEINTSSITTWAKSHWTHHQTHQKTPTWPPQEWFKPTTLRRLPPPPPSSSYTHHPSDDNSSQTNPISVEHHPQSISSADYHGSIPSPSNTISCASSDQQPSVQFMESPSNTISFAPLNQSHSDHTTSNPSSSSPPLQTTTSSPQTTLINESPRPLPPRSPNLIGNIKKNHHHPPPIHPNLIKEIGVKETLDAHLYRNEEGYKQVNQYILKHELGRGSFGAVQLAVDAETGLEYAVKEFSKRRLIKKYGQQQPQDDGLWLIRNEVAIMKKVKHPNIVKLREVLDVVGEDSLYMVLEYCRGGPLIVLKEDNSLPIDVCRKYFRQLIIGIDYLHRNMIIHHDIKPDNILLSSDRKQIKIADFGISAIFNKQLENNQVRQIIGSPAFLSPELILEGKSGTESDIWAMGVTLYCMVTGKLPFGKVDEPLDLYRSIIEDAPEIGEDWEPNLIELICKLLDKDPKSRIKLIEIENCSWINNSGLLPKLELNKENHHSKIDQKINEIELSKTFKLGLTNTCNGFIEIVKTAKLSNSRKEFFKEFYRLLSEKSSLISSPGSSSGGNGHE